jgi:hypothetical protein
VDKEVSPRIPLSNSNDFSRGEDCGTLR